MRTLFLVAVAAVALRPAGAHAQDQRPPVEMTAEEDHARTMERLGMDSIRPGKNGMNPDDPNYANYDEATANPYPNLPQVLRTMDRRIVDTPALWWDVRRPEIVELFDREIYGRVPDDVPGVTWETTATRDTTIGGHAVRHRDLVGHVDNSAYPGIAVDIDAILVLPAGADGPVPVILEFGFPHFRFRFPPGREPTGPSWQEQVVARGWGYAVIGPNSIQADNGAGLTGGIVGLANHGRPRSVDDWGALRAWAWGASRLLDFFETDPGVDATRVGLEGHSRYGKATLVAMAYDDRFAAAFVSSSGEGGAKLHRRNWGEIVENVAGSGEYHWMAGNFLKYAGPLTWDDLPIDAHELIALCAPRPVFISSGDVGDYWVDARGMFMAAAAASPVYELLGARGLSAGEFPPVETGVMDGDLTFRQHAEGHTPGPNWPFFLDFAARYFE